VKTKTHTKETSRHWSRILIIVTVVSATLACSFVETSVPTTHPTSAPIRTPIPTWTPTPKPTTGEISGQVIDASSSSPIPNANVTTDPPTISVTSNTQGRYVIPEVPPGVYTITATKPGYTSASVEVSVTAGKTTTADVHLMAMPSPTPQASLADGLVAYYPFNGNANDESEHGNHGIVHGAILADDRLGNHDSAYSFDGVDDYIASNSDISLDTTYSVALWFNYTESTESATLFHRGYQGWCWYEPKIHIDEASTLKVNVSGCSGEGTVGTLEIAPGEWYHVAIVARNGSQEFYVNGEKIASTGHTLRYTFAYKAFIGVSANQNTPVLNYFHGSIDDVRIYNRALSEAEVQALYEQDG
jgi:hypothetical protein